jgi:hypothetical protein
MSSRPQIDSVIDDDDEFWYVRSRFPALLFRRLADNSRP